MMRADHLYKALNGVFCVYKQPGLSLEVINSKIISNIFRLINNPDIQRPIKKRVAYHEENFGTNKPIASLVPDLADHPLVTGKRYQKSDFSVESADKVADYASGLCLLGINDCGDLWQFENACQIKVYHVEGVFGKATDDFTVDGQLKEKSTFRHITASKVDRVLSSLQAGHQTQMYHLAKVDLQSQEAYEIASSGLLRSRVNQNDAHVIYGVKLIHFDLPNFTVEIHCVNEQDDTLGMLIHRLGLELRSNACVKQCRRIRWGQFRLEHALNSPDTCPMDLLLKNINLCQHILQDEFLPKGSNIAGVDPLPLELQGRTWASNTRTMIGQGTEVSTPKSISSGMHDEQIVGADDRSLDRILWQAHTTKPAALESRDTNTNHVQNEDEQRNGTVSNTTEQSNPTPLESVIGERELTQ